MPAFRASQRLESFACLAMFGRPTSFNFVNFTFLAGAAPLLKLGCPGSRSSLGPSSSTSSTSSSCLRLLTVYFVNFPLSISDTLAHWTSMTSTVIPIDICTSYCCYWSVVIQTMSKDQQFTFKSAKILSVATTIKLSRTYRSAHVFLGEEVWQISVPSETRPRAHFACIEVLF